MPLPVIDDIFRVTLNWGYAGQSAANVMHVGALGGGASPSDVYDALNGNFQTNQWQCCVEDAKIQTIDILPLDGVSATQIFVPPDEDRYHGQVGLDAMISTGAIVSFRTSQRGPRGRGRLFFPFTGEPAQADGILDDTVQGSMQSEWIDFRDGLVSDGFALFVASYAHEDANIVLNIIVEEKLATQRRRQDRLRSS